MVYPGTTSDSNKTYVHVCVYSFHTVLLRTLNEQYQSFKTWLKDWRFQCFGEVMIKHLPQSPGRPN